MPKPEAQALCWTRWKSPCFSQKQGVQLLWKILGVSLESRAWSPSRQGCVPPPQPNTSRHWASVKGAGKGACCRLFANPTHPERGAQCSRGRAGKEGRAQHQAGLGPLSPRVGRCGWRPRCPSSPPRQAPPPALAPAWQRRLCLLRLRLETCCQLLPRHRGARHSRSSRPAEGPGSVRAGASKGPAQLSGLPPHHSRMLSWRKRKGPVGPSSCSQVSHGQDLSPHGMAL